MKRIASACLMQTLLFSPKERVSPEVDRASVRQEYEHYKKQMDHKRMRYEILSEEERPDGTLLVRAKRQYNNYSYDGYLA